MGFGAYRFRMWPFAQKWIGHPMPQGWDFFFSQKRPCWVVFHLRSGEMLGGYYGPKSHAAQYPHPPDVYVEAAWRLDEHGRFVEAVPRTSGMIVKASDCTRIEFYEEAPENAQPTGTSG